MPYHWSYHDSWFITFQSGSLCACLGQLIRASELAKYGIHSASSGVHMRPFLSHYTVEKAIPPGGFIPQRPTYQTLPPFNATRLDKSLSNKANHNLVRSTDGSVME